MRAPIGCALLFACGMGAGCGDAAPPQQAPAQKPLPPQAAPAPARVMPVEIVSLSPETIEVRGGRAVPTAFTVEYRIASPEKVEKAEIRANAPGVGIIKRETVPVQASASVTFMLDPIEDFGPVVRFRASCPAGVTEWRTLGAPALPYEDRASGDFKVTGVSPDHIKQPYTGDPSPGSGTSIAVHGRGFTPDCVLEAERDGSPIQLNNPYFRDGSLRGLLLNRDIDNRSISARYLEIGVAIHGPGIGQINIKRVPFSE